MKNKRILSIILMLFMILSTIGFAAAEDPLKLSVSFDKKTAKVGDNVTVTIVQNNTGTYDSFKNIILLISIIGNGTELDKSLYALIPAGDKGKNNFTPSTGLWQSNNLKKTSETGGIKTLIIYITIPSEFEGKTLTATAHYNSVKPDPVIPGLTFTTPVDNSDTLTIQKKSNPGTGNSTGTNTNTQTTNTIKTDATNAIKKATESKGGVESLQNLNQPNKGNTYEITNKTGSGSNDQRTIFAILGGIIIAVLIAFGYFKGIRS